jgi:hypothetical protein
MTNVILFPKSKLKTPPQTVDEFNESLEAINTEIVTLRKDYIEELIDDTMQDIFANFASEGFDLCDESCIRTTSMLIETLRAAVYKSVNIDHPLHAVAETHFLYPEELEAQKEE